MIFMSDMTRDFMAPDLTTSPAAPNHNGDYNFNNNFNNFTRERERLIENARCRENSPNDAALQRARAAGSTGAGAGPGRN